MRRLKVIVMILMGLALASCGPTPTPEVVERVVEVTREVIVMVTQLPAPTVVPTQVQTPPYPSPARKVTATGVIPPITPQAIVRQYGTSTPVPTPQGALPGKVNTAVLNLRSRPTMESRIKGKLYKGDMLSIVGKDPSGIWLSAITASGVTVWVHSDYIDLGQPLDSIQVVRDIPETWTIEQEGGQTIYLDSERQVKILYFHLNVMRVLAPSDANMETFVEVSEQNIDRASYYLFLKRAAEAQHRLADKLFGMSAPSGLYDAKSEAWAVVKLRGDAMEHLARLVNTGNLDEAQRAQAALKQSSDSNVIYFALLLAAGEQADLPEVILMVDCDEGKCRFVNPDQ